MKKIVVFGGMGFIGRHVVNELLGRGYEVVVYDRFINSHYTDLLPVENVHVFLGNITDPQGVSEAIYASDGAINLAGILGTSETVDNPYPSVHVNILGGINFLEGLRKHKKRGVQITVGNHFMHNSYAITKTTAERFALMYNKEHGTKCAVVRAMNAYGEGQKHKPVRKIIPNFVTQSLRGEAIKVFGDGEQVMDMVYVGDLAKVLVEALTKEHTCYDKVIEVGMGYGYTVNTIAEVVNAITGNTTPPTHLPMRQGEPPRSEVVANTATLGEVFNLVPDDDFVSLSVGLEKTVQWYKEKYNYKED